MTPIGQNLAIFYESKDLFINYSRFSKIKPVKFLLQFKNMNNKSLTIYKLGCTIIFLSIIRIRNLHQLD